MRQEIVWYNPLLHGQFLLSANECIELVFFFGYFDEARNEVGGRCIVLSSPVGP